MCYNWLPESVVMKTVGERLHMSRWSGWFGTNRTLLTDSSEDSACGGLKEKRHSHVFASQTRTWAERLSGVRHTTD